MATDSELLRQATYAFALPDSADRDERAPERVGLQRK